VPVHVRRLHYETRGLASLLDKQGLLVSLRMYCRLQSSMGTFAETAIFDNRLSFTDHGKQTFFFRFRSHQKIEVCHFSFTFAPNRSCHFLLVPFQTEKENGSPGDFPFP
jgi:hypothetical protein